MRRGEGESISGGGIRGEDRGGECRRGEKQEEAENEDKIEIKKGAGARGRGTRETGNRRTKGGKKRSKTILDQAKSSDRHRGSTSGPLSSTDPRATIEAKLEDGTTTAVMTLPQAGLEVSVGAQVLI